MWACKDGHKDVVQMLLEHSNPRIDINAKANNGSTAFIMACERGQKEVVKLLLESSEIDISGYNDLPQDEIKDFIELHLIQMLLNQNHFE